MQTNLAIRTKSKNNRQVVHTRFPALCIKYTCLISFDWFTGLALSFVIGQSDNFGLGF